LLGLTLLVWIYSAIVVVHPDAMNAYHDDGLRRDGHIFTLGQWFAHEWSYWSFLILITLFLTFPVIPVFLLGWVLLFFGSSRVSDSDNDT